MARILVVEDDLDAASALETLLRRGGHEVTRVQNGREALSALSNAQLDLIVLDLMLPEMNGTDLLGIIRSYIRWRTIPVVVWTGASDAIVDRAWRKGVTTVILKGQSTYTELLQAIARALPESATT